jgi:DivIVA domain-containing protein
MGSLAPEDIANRRFAAVGRRGYDREEVETFLVEVAQAYREALDVVARADESPTFELLGREAGAVLEAARQGAESLRESAEEEVQSLTREAREGAEEVRREAETVASEILERAAQEAERAMREAELVARRLRNVTKRQCSELLAEAQTRQERLAAHERELRRRISEIEAVFETFRAEMDAEELPAPEEEAPPEPAESADEEEQPIRLEVEPVQPKPVFEHRSTG